MKGESDLQQYVDLLVPSNAKLTLLQWEGPMNLLGSHCVDFFGYKDVETDSEEEDKNAGEDYVDMDENTEKGDKKTPTKVDGESKKRIPRVLRRRKKKVPLSSPIVYDNLFFFKS